MALRGRTSHGADRRKGKSRWKREDAAGTRIRSPRNDGRLGKNNKRTNQPGTNTTACIPSWFFPPCPCPAGKEPGGRRLRLGLRRRRGSVASRRWREEGGLDPAAADGNVNSYSEPKSDNSYDYLSVEEKECLMFLEETIGSLDAEADSGVSTDETDSAEPAKLPRTWPKRDSGPRDLEKGAPAQSTGQQRATEQKSEQKASAFSSSAPAAFSSPGYYSLPRNIAAANAQRANKASDSKATAHAMGDPVPKEKPWQETAREERLDQASARSQAKPLGSIIIQPPEAFQEAVAARGGLLLSRGSDGSRGKAEPESRAAAPDPGPEREGAALARGLMEKPALEEDSDAKRGPPTAPKPRKLPPNIILKTSKNKPVPLATEPGHKAKTPSQLSATFPASCATAEKPNPGHLDPKEREKARREALEKLGLPQDKREPNIPLKAVTSPKPKEAPGAARRDNGTSEDAAAITAAGRPEEEHQVLRGPTERVAPGARQVSFKSNTLERSGVGLSSYISSKDQSVKSSSSLGKMSFIERIAPSFLRSSRPRPASLGTGKDFASLKEPNNAELEKSSKRRSHPLPSFSKPARSSCVSVKISPKGATEEHRREALKKLGLLKE
ncbi:specifically androgen-regulated gene protein isoform X2 [Struthio camelus]|uniref:specifically androgen-regulated gene protein isoform X2 n=1 Tax=Struthio camelus TaxID=8801 RepID=UPI003603CB46